MTRTSKGANVMQNNVSESTPLYEYPPVRKHMSPKDVALCQQAIDLANSGQKQAAYKQFCLVYHHGNTEDVTLLYWIAATTPSPVEAQIAIDTIARIEPNHPKLQALRAYLDRERPLDVLMGPIVQCPYCHMTARTLIKRKVSTGGWVLFAGLLTGLLVSFLVCSVIPVPSKRGCGCSRTPRPYSCSWDASVLLCSIDQRRIPGMCFLRHKVGVT
jgi:hypothetical protein